MVERDESRYSFRSGRYRCLSRRVTVAGGNTITGNGTAGTFVIGSIAVVGDSGFGVPTNNMISGNATNGISVGLGSAPAVLNATMQNNGVPESRPRSGPF
jgi:hypothetical protein